MERIEETDAVSALVASIASLSFDSGYDEEDGIAVLVDEPKIEITSAPTRDLLCKLQPEDMTDSLSVSKLMDKEEEEESRLSFLKKISKLMQKMKNLGTLSCVKPKHELDDFGTKEVFIRDVHAKTSDREEVPFGMHVHSVREDGIMRHFVSRKEAGSVADSFTLCDRDELLMIEDSPVVDVSPLVMLSYFRDLPMDQPVSFITRRALEKFEGHIIYEYYILKGSIHIIEDEIEVVEQVYVETAVGLNDLLDVKFIGRDQRSFRSQDDVIVRITDGRLDLDSKNNIPFHFEVLRYKATQVPSFHPVLIWIVRHSDDSSCYLISKDKQNTDVQLFKEDKESDSKTEWEAFTENGIKWITKSTADLSDKHVFQSLINPDMFLCSSHGVLQCVKKSGWEDAQTDSTTHFNVTPNL